MLKQYWLRALSIPALVIASSASAEVVSYPGGNCVTADMSPAAGTTFWDGEFSTRSTTAQLAAYCPVETSSAAPIVNAVKVVFTDRNTSQNASCFLNVQWMTEDGVVHWYAAPMLQTAGASLGPQTRSTSTSLDGRLGTMQLQCSVPAASSIGTSSIMRYEITR